MEPAPRNHTIYRFSQCEFDVARFELRRNGEPVKLEKIPMELLLLLLENEGRLVTRQQILDRLWGPNVFVDAEQGINTAVRKIRLAITGTGTADPIQTVVGKGYRFALPIEVAGDPVPSVPAKSTSKPLVSRGFLYALAAVIVIAAALLFVQYRAASFAPIRSIAVLPLDNFSGPSDDYFADGTTDAIITRLAQTSGLHVISRTSVMRFKGSKRDIKQIARELNVDALVEGSVSRQGDRVRIIAQLIDGRTDRHLWAQQYERDLHEVLKLQADVADAVATNIRSSVSPNSAATVPAAIRIEPAAYDDYLRARVLADQRTPDSLVKAIDLYRRSIETQPRYSDAYAGLANAYAALGYNSFVAPDDAFPKAKAAAQQALQFEPNSADALAALGYTQFYFDWNIPAAEASFAAALKANRNHNVTHQWLSVMYTSQSRYDEAAREIAQARALDPLSTPIDTDMGFELYYAGKTDDAIRHLTAVTTVAPNFPPAHLWLGRAYEQNRMYPKAVEELERADHLVPDWPVTVAALGHARAMAGDQTGARHELQRLETLAKTRFVTPYAVALLYAGLNDRDNAFRWLNRAYDERSHWLVWLRTDPRFSNLRDDPRFKEVVQKIASSSR